MDEYLASIFLFAGNFEPVGGLFCHGQAMSIAQNSAVFSLLGTTYGGNGSTTFNLPDLRGRTPIGQGTGPNLKSYTLGEMGGAETVTLVTNQIPAHTHTADISNLSVAQPANSSLATTGTPGANLGPAQLGKNGSGPSAQATPAYGTPDGTTTLAPGKATGTITNQATGGGLAHENRMPYTVINYVIVMQGIFPSRS